MTRRKSLSEGARNTAGQHRATRERAAEQCRLAADVRRELVSSEINVHESICMKIKQCYFSNAQKETILNRDRGKVK